MAPSGRECPSCRSQIPPRAGVDRSYQRGKSPGLVVLRSVCSHRLCVARKRRLSIRLETDRLLDRARRLPRSLAPA